MGSTGDARSGLGVPCAIPTPAASLISVLRLHGSEDLTLRADAGLGLGLVTWRADYDISDYHLPNANTTGCGIVIRPDLLDDLLQRLGPRLIIATS